MFGIGKLILDKCEEITTVVDGVAMTKYVLYDKAGKEVIISVKKVKVSDIDAKIATLQAEKLVITNITKGE